MVSSIGHLSYIIRPQNKYKLFSLPRKKDFRTCNGSYGSVSGIKVIRRRDDTADSPVLLSAGYLRDLVGRLVYQPVRVLVLKMRYDQLIELPIFL